MKKTFILCIALLTFLFSQSQIYYLKGNLQSSQEVPGNTSTASGVVIVKYDQATKKLEVFGDYAGLTKEITGSHIHRGEPGVAGPIVVPLVNTADTTGALSGTGTLTQAQEDSLLAGNMYANVHTETNPGGELRAQLTVATSGQATFLTGRLQGAQEVPPNPSTAKGSVHALVDMATDSVFVTGSYTGLTTPSNNAHVHLAIPGTAGDVLFPVRHSMSASGTVHATTLVNAAQASLIISGGSYVNVHTQTYPAGEIRGQLVNNSTVRYFAGEMAGTNEVPANTSAARGTVIVVYDTEKNLLQLAGDYQKLSDTVTAAHIHVGAPGVAGPPIVPLNTTRDSTGAITIIGATITEEQETDLLAGNMYVNVHNKTFPDGEIRAQLVATTSGETQLFITSMTGAQEAPPTTSTAVGNALVILDRATGIVHVTSAFQGLNSGVTGAHLHHAPVGVAGPVFLPLMIAIDVTSIKGTASGSGTVSASIMDSMINGLTYINIHSVRFTAGAIRGQLGDLVLPIKLTSFNAYKQKNEVELTWQTSEELNLSRYEIEQLNTQSNSWITKGTVYSKGASTGAAYSFTDKPNLYGSNYLIYRLKIIDKDEKFTYSHLQKLNFERLKAELFIRTNPVVNGELKYTIAGLPTGKKAEVSIIDYHGRLILRNSISSLTNNTVRIPRLSAGMYKLVVRVDDTVLQKSFIK